MITIKPISRAIVPVNSEAAAAVSGKNYDEFQGDYEIWEIIKKQPSSILKITMAHCDAAVPENMMPEGSPEALEHGAVNFKALLESDQTEIAEDILCLYQIVDETGGTVDQTGILGMAKTAEIRTGANPNGTVIRNENIYEKKAGARAKLIKKTSAFIGIVNNVVEDTGDHIYNAIEKYKDNNKFSYSVADESGFTHKVWLIRDLDAMNEFTGLLRREPNAFVADGNHRSAAAASLNKESYLAIFSPIRNLKILHYNRLIKETGIAGLTDRLAENYDVEMIDAPQGYQPTAIHDVGIYIDKKWIKLTARPQLYEGQNAAGQIDSDIVQRTIIKAIFGITKLTDKRINFVGGDRDAAYLMDRVDSGEYECAITMAPVTMRQFIQVCKENLLMPPKSTWFSPKIRSGMVIALFED